MNAIDDFAILEKPDEIEHESKRTIKDLKQALDALRIKLPDEALHACLAEFSSDYYQPINFLYRIIELLTPAFKKSRYENPLEERPIYKLQNHQNFVDDCAETELVTCTEGCGRKFRAEIIGKHLKICKHVFQNKPRVFEPVKPCSNENSVGENIHLSKGIEKLSKKSYKVPSCLYRDEALQAAILSKREAKKKEENKLGKPVACTEGCGRIFTFLNGFETHVKVCKKVFQEKRPVFESVNQRKTEEQVLFETIPFKKVEVSQQNVAQTDWKSESKTLRELVKNLRQKMAESGLLAQPEEPSSGSQENTENQANAQAEGLGSMVWNFKTAKKPMHIQDVSSEAMQNSKMIDCVDCGHTNVIVLKEEEAVEKKKKNIFCSECGFKNTIIWKKNHVV